MEKKSSRLIAGRLGMIQLRRYRERPAQMIGSSNALSGSSVSGAGSAAESSGAGSAVSSGVKGSSFWAGFAAPSSFSLSFSKGDGAAASGKAAGTLWPGSALSGLELLGSALSAPPTVRGRTIDKTTAATAKTASRIQRDFLLTSA